MSIEAKINYQLNKYPALKRYIKRIYQRSMYLISPKIKSEGNIFRISPNDNNEYFFGYYDKSPWDINDRYVLCMKAKDTWSDVSPRDKAQIILIDTGDNNKVTVLAETSAWNVQQGCMLQWLGPDYNNRIIFNDCRDGRYCSVILKLSIEDEKVNVVNETVINVPVYSVSTDGTFALTLDFSRLYRLRPGYGYYNVPEKTADMKLPDEPCIWHVDLITGNVKPILKYTDFYSFEQRPEMIDAEHKVNHIMLSPNGKRFMVLHRWFVGQRKYTRLITCNVDGSDMYNLSDDDMVSHCFWRTNKQIFAFENKKKGIKGDKAGNGYYLMKDKTQEYRRYWTDVDYDGHPSYSPDGRMVLFDRYPDRKRIASVMICEAKERLNTGVEIIAKVFAPFKYDNDTRCDLHPRWNRKGNKICFDSVFEGHRGLYYVDVSEHVQKDTKSFQPLISVIVPVYNVEKYLKRCVDSIIKQTYKNLEIILVDDGSTDMSSSICDELACLDDRIQVIHKENGGLSSARNMGMLVCKGDYVAFVDSDDWVALDTYKYLMKLIMQNHADVAQINYKTTSKYTMNAGDESEKICVYKDKDILQHFMHTTTTTTGSYSVCRCLFQKNLLDGLTFREGKINEDIDYKYKVLSRTKVFVESNLKKYFYFQSTGSTTTSGLRKKDFDLYDAAEELYQLTCNENYGDIKFLGEVKKRRTAFSLLSRIAYYGIADKTINEKEIVKKLTREHRKNLIILLKSPMSFSRKVVAIILAININLLKPLLYVKKIYDCVF